MMLPKKNYRPLVFILSPYAKDFRHDADAEETLARMAVRDGFIPLAAHLMYSHYLYEGCKDDHEFAMNSDVILMGKCDELWVVAPATPEMMTVIDRARNRRQTIRYFTNDFVEREVL